MPFALAPEGLDGSFRAIDSGDYSGIQSGN